MAKLISAKDAKSKINNKDTVFIDVRSPAEYESMHIPSSYNIPLDVIDDYKDNIKKLDKNLIIICRSGKRATIACQKIDEVKSKDIKVLEGGITSWNQHEYKVKQGKQMWDIERQVRFAAGSLVLLGVLLGFFVSSNWFILSGLVGLGLSFAALTNTCMMGYLFSKLPYNRGYNYKLDLDKLFN